MCYYIWINVKPALSKCSIKLVLCDGRCQNPQLNKWWLQTCQQSKVSQVPYQNGKYTIKCCPKACSACSYEECRTWRWCAAAGSSTWRRSPSPVLLLYIFSPQTYNTDTQVPDSAGTATAMFSGVKTRAGMLGLDGTAAYNVCAPASIQVHTHISSFKPWPQLNISSPVTFWASEVLCQDLVCWTSRVLSQDTCWTQTQAATVTSLADWASATGKEVGGLCPNWQAYRTELQQVTSTPQVGVVSTARITHATPGAIYSHCPMRDWEADVNLPTDSAGCIDIATQVPSSWQLWIQTTSLPLQLIDSMEEGKVVVALGGGRRNFQTVENGGRRSLKDLVNRLRFSYITQVQHWQSKRVICKVERGRGSQLHGNIRRTCLLGPKWKGSWSLCNVSHGLWGWVKYTLRQFNGN